ncbi:hypothetical protein [Algoriphagus formosus]|uniref:hypothetical protein n=1 Tax=Algoriphagus formosus TaxID=2007308 RepID=UPI0012FDD1AA|nr:hypothetical protein [Algoriphagus formosus]
MDVYLTIDEYMDTFFAFLTFMSGVFSLCILYKGYRLGKKYLLQHAQKLKIEEFYEVRSKLYWEIDRLQNLVLNVVRTEVRIHELRGISKSQEVPFLSDEERVLFMNGLLFAQQVQVTHDRIIQNKNSIIKCVGGILEILLFLDLDFLKQSFENIRIKCEYLTQLVDPFGTGQPSSIEIVTLQGGSQYEVRHEDVNPEESGTGSPNYYDAMLILHHLHGPGFREDYGVDFINSLFEDYKKLIIKTPERIVFDYGKNLN